MPINPVHIALLRTGKVLVVSGSGNVAANTNFQAALWDPQTGTITTQPVGWDMFCNGMVVLPDGRPFVIGGTLQYDPFHGELRTSVYDPATGTFTDLQSMAHGRWYPTATVLGDGSVMTFSGLTETGGTNTTVEIYSVGSGWGPAFSAPWTPPLYPRMHLLPSGNVFYSGSTTGSSIFNPSTHTWTTNVAFTNYSGTRTYGTSVLLPLTPANGYKPRVMIFGGGNPSTATTELIDLSAATPKWAYGPNMSQPRIEMDATILPNGKILALGGSLNDEDTATASLNADLYDPATNTFSSAGAEVYARLYHSVSVLLPDATVWVAGGNPQRGSYESHMEVYSPAYLFNSNGTRATRPSITSLSSSVIGYGSAFQINTPDAASISSAVLMRNGAVTHAFDMDQRFVGLSFTAGSGVLNVTGPPNGNIAPPGYYMLFILNASGVPSVASMVQISGAAGDIPPTGTITTPASNVTITAGQSVSYSGTGTDPDGTISAYSWSFPGGSPSSSALANPGNVIYSTPGTYVTTFTVTDNAGLTDPHPPTRTITVSSAVSPGITFVQANSATPQTPQATVAVPFQAAQTSGNLNVVVVGWNDSTAAVSSVKDSTGNLYALAAPPVVQSGTATQAIYYAKNIAAATANTVTVTFNVAALYPDIRIAEYSGLDTVSPLDVSVGAQGNTATSNSGTITTTNANDLLVGANLVQSTTVAPGAGFTSRGITTLDGDILEDQVVTSVAAYSATAVLDKAQLWIMQLVAFRAAGSAPSPTAPSNLMATAASPVQINLSWTAATQTGGTISQYLIESCTGTACSSFAQVGTSATTAFSDTGLSGSTTYNYRVRATNAANVTGPYSNQASATTAAPTFTAPTNLTAAVAGSTQINLSWTAATESGGTISQYLIERCQGSACSNFAQVAASVVTAFNDTGLLAGTNYSYRVRATDATNNLGPYSNVASATTTSTPPPSITFVQANSATPQTPQATVAVPFQAAQTSGNLNVVVVGWNDSTAAVSSVKDSTGNLYALAAPPVVQSGTATQAIYYAKNIAAATANTVTVTFNVAALYPDIRIAEYSGLDTVSPLDVSVGAQGNTATSNSGTITTTNANDLLVGANLVQSTTVAPGAGFTSRGITTLDGDILEDQVVTSVAAYSATAVLDKAQLWIMQLVTFKRHP
jgi:hypothetical protein